MKKGKKRKTPVKLFQTKRIISFILSMLMVFGNVANNASIVYAAEAVQGLKRTPDSIFLLDRDELQEAALAAIEDGEAFDPSVLLFTEGTKSSLSSKYKKLFGGSGSSVYEFDSNYSGDKIADGTDLRTFVRVDGNKKEIIFLFTNYSIEDMNFQINVNGYVSDVITVESATERVAGEADIIDKEETQPVETEPEADLPEETTESQPQGPGETSAEESTKPSETTEEVQAPDTEETSAAEETSSEAETTETVTEPETTAEETTAEEASTEETTTAASVPEETSEEITEEETSIEMPEEITAEETTEAVEEPDAANEPEDAAASLEDNVAQEAEGDMVAMSRHNVPRVATLLEGMSEAAEENTDAAEESQKQEPAVTEPAITEPAATEPATTEPAVTEPAATEPAATEPEITESSAEIPEETTGAADPTEAPTEPETETIITIDDPKTTEPEETTAPSEELIDEDIIDADIISDEITDQDTAAVYGSLKGGKVYGLVELDETYTARAFVISLDRLMEQTASEEELLPEEVLIPETPAVLEPAEDTVIEAEVTGGDVSIRIEIPADLGIDVDHAVAEPVDTEPLWPVVEAAGPEEMQLQDMKAYDIMLYDGDGNEIHELDGRVNVIFDGLDAELTDSEEVNVYYLQTPAVSRFKSSARMSGYNLTQMQDSGIDGEGSVSFRTDHFSTYIVTFWNIGSKDVKLNLITKDVQTGGQIGNEIDRNFEDFYRGSGARVSTEELADKVMDEDEMLENYDYKGTLLSGTYSEDSRRVAEIYVSYRGNIEYRFSGETKWRELSGVNLYLWFEKQQTKITFHSNNGEKDTYKLGVEGDTITMPDLETTGFENGGRQFLGWSSDRSGQAQLLQPGETIQSASASNDYYAVWSYMATFKANGGNGNDHYVQANQDGSVVMPKLDETGFENGRRQFLGWSLSSGSRSDLLQSGASVNLERDTVYYAVWTYEAVFNANGGRGDDFYLAENSDGKFIMPDQQAVGFTNGEKTLIGWSKSRTDRADLFLPGQEVKASDSKYYAVWSYNVIFNANTGSGSKTFEKAMENGKLVMPSQEETSFTNGDRALLGWSLRPTNRDNVILPGAVISVNNDTTYYAVWSYQATFYPNKNEGGYLEDDKLAHVIPISSNGTVELPSAAAIGLKNRNEKKVFAGWVVGSASATDVFGPEITYSGLKKDTYFYARWIDTEAEGSVKAQYYVRKDGVIQAEPSQYEEKDYFPKAPGMAGTIKVAMRVNNDFDAVEANLGRVPTDATIQAAASKAGYSFDPETQYVRWYVIKVSSGKWHVDGVIQEKSQYSVIYHPNKGTDYFPDIVQYTAGENVKVDYSKLPVRDGYEFAGWDRDPDSSYPEYPMPKGSERAPEFVMPEYDVDLYAIWKPSNNTRITVEHYWQKADADQAVSETDFEYYESKPAYGTTGETVYDADYKMDYQGFTYQEGIVDGRSSETVEADGTTVLKLYYTRNQNTKYLVEHYVQDLNADTYSFKESTEGSGITGRAAEYVPNAYPGFEYNENATKFYSRKGSNDSEVNSSAILADGSLVIKLYYTRRNNIGYTVEYYYQENGKYSDTANYYDQSRSGGFGETVSVTAADKIPVMDKYVYDENAANITSGTISEDGLILKLYFKQTFTVTYKPGIYGTFENDIHRNVPYGDATPEFGGTLEGRPGYRFERWDPAVEPAVEHDAVYTAIWSPESTKYHVEYYYQNQGTYSHTADDKSDDRFALTDTSVKVTDEDLVPAKAGYVFDEHADSLNILEGTVAGDGSLVLKVYFKQQFTVTYEPGTQGTFTAETTENLDYNAVTPEFKGNTTGNTGYTFIGWLPEIADTVTEDAVYVAQWAANEDTEYKVEYYYETAGTYRDTADDYTMNRGTTDTLAEVTSSDKIPSKEGYVYDGEAGNVLSGIIKGDGSLVLKVYFKQQFTVTYEPGTQGTFTAETAENLDYNAVTPEFKGNTTGNAGY
ncbi:MAG: InlB B-repeat-containing protein, partial [Clostridiaceae bacterium]|nr:InlB B-repeat-containing protein [Clostridiaceae bacterium]